MAQAAVITVNDRETTPVAHNFAPRSVVPGVAAFVEANTVPIGEKTLTIRTRRGESQFVVRITLDAPVLVMETINGVQVPSVPRKSIADLTFRFSEQSTEQERKNLVGMIANALASSQVVIDGCCSKLEGIW